MTSRLTRLSLRRRRARGRALACALLGVGWSGVQSLDGIVPRRGAGPGPGTRPAGQRPGRCRAVADDGRWGRRAATACKTLAHSCPAGSPAPNRLEIPVILAGGVGDDPGDEIVVAAAGQDGAARVGQEFGPEQRP